MRYTVLVLFLFFASIAAMAKVKHVILISVDGGKAASIAKLGSLTNIHELVRAGAASWKAQTIPLSVTLPSHASMISGVGMSKHEMVWNDYDPSKKNIRVPTIFTLTEKAGLSSALFAAKEKFRHLAWMGGRSSLHVHLGKAGSVASAAATFFRERKPSLLMVHFADADTAGHAHGWDTKEFRAALAHVDEAVGALRRAVRESGLEKDTLFLLTADHGGTGKTHGQDIPEHREIPWIASGAGVKKGVPLTAKISTMDTAATILWQLGLDVPKDWEGKPVREAFQ